MLKKYNFINKYYFRIRNCMYSLILSREKYYFDKHFQRNISCLSASCFMWR